MYALHKLLARTAKLSARVAHRIATCFIIFTGTAQLSARTRFDKYRVAKRESLKNRIVAAADHLDHTIAWAEQRRKELHAQSVAATSDYNRVLTEVGTAIDNLNNEVL